MPEPLDMPQEPKILDDQALQTRLVALSDEEVRLLCVWCMRSTDLEWLGVAGRRLLGELGLALANERDARERINAAVRRGEDLVDEENLRAFIESLDP